MRKVIRELLNSFKFPKNVNRAKNWDDCVAVFARTCPIPILIVTPNGETWVKRNFEAPFDNKNWLILQLADPNFQRKVEAQISSLLESGT